MPTNLAINDELLDFALKIGGYKTKKDTVNVALQEFIQKRRSEEIIDLFGKIEFDDGYDYKLSRQRQ